MAYVLLPGRQILNTKFQASYLSAILHKPIPQLSIWNGVGNLRPADPIDTIVFAITSANQSHSRYNPIPLDVRAIGVDRFARSLSNQGGIQYRIIPIPHFSPSARFCEFILKEISEATEGQLALSPTNTLVYTSTPAICRDFQELGFGILPGELAGLNPNVWNSQTPMEALKIVVEPAEQRLASSKIREIVSDATLGVWQDFPHVISRVMRLFRDPVLTENGNLTETRNYSTYAQGMNQQAVLELKYQDIHQAIVPGKIVDEGCADGALLVPISKEFPDSDLIGIEITGEFLERCHERQRAQEYAGSYIHFHQRNITEPIFAPDSIDTTICNSTIHELWSYGQQEITVRAYLREKYRQSRTGGRVIIRDVVGPENKDQEVWLWCNETDGKSRGAVELLSTSARFEQFAQDYLHHAIAAGRRKPSVAIRFRTEHENGKQYRVLTLKDAVEFLMKKDYTDNWKSEMQEEFAFWSFSQWKQELIQAGWQVIEDSSRQSRGSRAYRNEWIVKNRLSGKAELFQKINGKLQPMDYPVTNMVLVVEK